MGNAPASAGLTVDFERFHRVELPQRLLAGNGALAASALAGIDPMAFEVSDTSAFSYVPLNDTVEIVAGTAHATAVARVTESDWSQFAGQMRTFPCLHYDSALSIPRGDLRLLMHWEPAMPPNHRVS